MGKTHTVLIVDDEVDFLSSVRRVLRKEPYEVVTATNGTDALELLASRPVHLVVSDYKMPGMDGLVLLEKVRLSSPCTVTLLLTALSDVGALTPPAARAGVSEILFKPIDVEHFKLVLRRALEGHGRVGAPR